MQPSPVTPECNQVRQRKLVVIEISHRGVRTKPSLTVGLVPRFCDQPLLRNRSARESPETTRITACPMRTMPTYARPSAMIGPTPGANTIHAAYFAAYK